MRNRHLYSKYQYSCPYCQRGVGYWFDRCGSCRQSIGYGGTRPGENILALKIIAVIVAFAVYPTVTLLVLIALAVCWLVQKNP